MGTGTGRALGLWEDTGTRKVEGLEKELNGVLKLVKHWNWRSTGTGEAQELGKYWKSSPFSRGAMKGGSACERSERSYASGSAAGVGLQPVDSGPECGCRLGRQQVTRARP